MERALEALRRFRTIARILKVKNLRAIATAAVREAQDGRDFIARAEKAAGTKIEILSGEKEAELAAHGIRMGFLNADGLAGDLGGGSLEIIDIYHDRLNDASTLPLGGLRLIDQTGDKIEKALPLVDETIARVNWLAKGRGRPFYAVGGTWRALAKLHMEHIDYPLRVMHGYSIPTARSHRVLPDGAPRQEDLGAAGHRGRGTRTPRGAALRRSGAGAAARGARALRGCLLGLRHPRGPAVQPACPSTRRSKIRCSASARIMLA